MKWVKLQGIHDVLLLLQPDTRSDTSNTNNPSPSCYSYNLIQEVIQVTLTTHHQAVTVTT